MISPDNLVYPFQMYGQSNYNEYMVVDANFV